MSDDETRPIEPGAPTPPPAPEAQQPTPDAPAYAAQPAYAMPLPAGYPAYATQQEPRPRFGDQVMGMWAVVAVALACLVIGGLSGFILGHASSDREDGFLRGPGTMNFQGGPDGFGQNGIPNGQNGIPNQPHQ